ncbi:MAG: S-formylglutathione hydrolase [Kordiimonadaceae bacterium]|jgi:S-formylglutathione hydrolase|nr:S-formylglutathione hydrolase [Kordiimonadaceae bacterium]MBT6037548.1 S-formylglutathione hydrolase [Kordiimonadaceae bacterium]MBT6329041.1 S-formylglutathione hydrolase [Kordiimonadaceae bacterium]MBT7582069.1 S-formylglutathione hydrolase [Kordiimonadaceae bacterium]
MDLKSKHKCHGGILSYYSHRGETVGCVMNFTVFLPPQAESGKCPALYYLAGLTCTEDNFTTKSEAYKMATELGLILIAPDTSPRGEHVPDEEGWDFGKGAGFYVDATQEPWDKNYNMYSYITHELYNLVLDNFPVDQGKVGIFGHSMGGHGALTIYLKNKDKFKSVSAFAPIVSPTNCPWGHKALGKYIGEDRTLWADHDASLLMKAGGDASNAPEILIDQGLGDPFLEGQLKPELFEDACLAVNQQLTLRRHPGYDHGYFFISTFMEDHLKHHMAILR